MYAPGKGKSTNAYDISLPIDDYSSTSAEPEAGPSHSDRGGGDDTTGGDGPSEEPKKKSTRGSRACTVCRKLKMRCVGAEEGPPCKRCKNGGHECIFEESQRGRRSNRKTDAMAKSLKSMEAKLESVLASISTPGLMAGSGGLVTDPSLANAPVHPLDSGPGGAEGRGDVHIGVSMDAGMVASALEAIRQGRDGGMGPVSAGIAGGPPPGSGMRPPQQATRPGVLHRVDSESAIRRRDPITLPSINGSSELQSAVRFEGIGGGIGIETGRQQHFYPSHPQPTMSSLHPLPSAHGHPHAHPHAHPHSQHHHGANGLPRPPSLGGSSQSAGKSPMEWSGVGSDKTGQTDGSPRLHSLPDNTLNPLGLLAEASLRNTRKRPVDLTEDYEVASDAHADEAPAAKSKGKGSVNGKRTAESQAGDGDKVDGERDSKKKKVELGMANRNYFAPGPMNILPLRRIVIEQRMPPALLEEKILSVEEVVELFEIFFTHCHRHAPFLDPEIHTPAATGSRSPFLFTCICTVAARYYTKRTDDLYRKCLRTAKRVAFDVMTKGYKSTEICQGFLLLCCWNQPAERFEEERTYQFSGIAIRMATDLNLHRKTIAQLPSEINEDTRMLYDRELLNRERAWMYSFICDRSVSTQMGKPYSIPREDYIIRSASNWYTQPGSIASDVGLSAMVEMHRIIGRMIDVLYSDTRSVSGLNAHLDYPLLMRAFLQQLDQWRSDWTENEDLVREADGHSLSNMHSMRDYYHAYYRLFLLSFAVQHALEDRAASIDLPRYCVLCFEAAERIISILRDHLGPSGTLKYAMDSTFVYASYAAVFLLKLVSPTFSSFIDEDAAMRLVRDTADVLEKSAVDEQHTPALYGSFLRALIENKLNGPRTAANSRAPTRPGSPNGNNGSFAQPLNPTNGAAGLDSYLRSRANSVGPEGLDQQIGPNFMGDLPTFTPGGSFNFNGHGDGVVEEGAAHDAFTVDTMLQEGGFWSQMLMPGFGEGFADFKLSGGTGTVFSGNSADPWSVTPLHSRPGSPVQAPAAFPPSFDSGLPTDSSAAPASSGVPAAAVGEKANHLPAPPPPPPPSAPLVPASVPAPVPQASASMAADEPAVPATSASTDPVVVNEAPEKA
ncbi:Zn(II)2Cys6 transcription factor [Sporobolomyces koalae]|uniref:Zn(II)2Cys6 transcription factor n=1 Tax=Sporobolomyces koalae TaxID=500713 RepID=UPI00316AFEB4